MCVCVCEGRGRLEKKEKKKRERGGRRREGGGKREEERTSERLFCKGVPVKRRRFADRYSFNSLINLEREKGERKGEGEEGLEEEGKR